MIHLRSQFQHPNVLKMASETIALDAHSEPRLRAFTAIAVPAAVTETLAGWITALPEHAPLRWTSAEKLHLTLTFLGHITLAQKDALTSELSPLEFPSVEIVLRGAEYFSSSGALVINVGATKTLRELQEQVAQACERAGCPREARDYQPHITLARQPRGATRPLAMIGGLQRHLETKDAVSFMAASLALYESRAGHYHVLKQFEAQTEL